MKKLFIFLMFIMLFGCKISNIEIKNAFSKHELSVMLLPDTQTLLAKDTLQINYLDKTNDLYFYLNSSLTVKKVKVGNLNINFSKVENKYPEFVLPAKDSVLYKVELPKSLFPNKIDIWYEGRIPQNLNQLEFTDIHNNILLNGKQCWYPSIPGFKSSFTVKALTMDKDSTLTCNANLICLEKNDLCLLCYWEQPEPVQYLDFYLPGN